MTLSLFGILDILFLVVHILLCVALIGIVLIQGGKGATMSASFGLGSSSAFGAQTDTFMVKWTRNIAVAFLVTSLGLTFLAKTAGSLTQTVNLKEKAQEENAAPALPAMPEAAPPVEAVPPVEEKAAPGEAAGAVAPATGISGGEASSAGEKQSAEKVPAKQ